jgi:hypothetical protein
MAEPNSVMENALKLASLRGRLGRRLREIVENLALHAFDFGSVTSRYEGQFLGTTADPQSRQ